MSLALLERALSAANGLTDLTASERTTLGDWVQSEVERIAPVLTPAAWLIADDVSLDEVLIAILERGASFVEDATRDPETLRDLVAPTSRLLGLVDDQDDVLDDDDRMARPAIDWPEVMDVAAWRKAHPALAADRALRDDRLAERVGDEPVVEFIHRVSGALVAGEDVAIGQGGALGAFQVKSRRGFVVPNPITGETIDVKPRSIVVFRSGDALKAALQGAGSEIAGDGVDEQVLRGVAKLLRDDRVVALPGLGWFGLSRRRAFETTNPETGELLAVPERVLPVFRGSPVFYRRLNGPTQAAPRSPSPAAPPVATPEPPPKKPWWKVW